VYKGYFFQKAPAAAVTSLENEVQEKGLMRYFSVRVGLCMFVALVAQAGAPLAIAQTTNVNTSIVGIVHDPSGAKVVGAEVALKNLASDQTLTVSSDASGKYSLRNLSPGTYEVTATKYGFEDAETRVVIGANQQLHADLKLKLTKAQQKTLVSVDAKKLDAMEARIEQLEAMLKQRTAPPQSSFGSATEASATPPISAAHGPLLATLAKDGSSIPLSPGSLPPTDLSKTVATTAGPAGQQAALPPAGGQNTAPPPAPQVDTQTPFAFGDFTWLNGTPRNKDVVVDTPFFTPEVRFDTHFMEDFNQPVDHTIVGATESFRSGEVQLEQVSVGGDFHWQNVRGRVLYMGGLFATTTPRNDASFGVGQWDLRGAYKYMSEAWGGYHFNVQHGLNVDAGIFVSYIGLFSYYNFDNWTYQPSYVSSNTPWFFNGLRIQWFPTNKLKIEPWVINGWQSYAKYNGHVGLGGQFLWMPTEWFKLVANQYGFGQDNLGLPHTERIHTDDSIEIRFYNNPNKDRGISKIAMSLTGDAGTQYGGGICGTCSPSQNKDSFVGWMLYNRYWWNKDKYAVTFGGGEMSNYGRYLTLLPPIDGADAVTGSVYFPEVPGSKAHMWDSTVTFQYMPRQYITWWAEVGYRHSDVPYFAGRGGVTPPGFPIGGTNGYPQYYTCNSGATSGTADLAAATAGCSGSGGVWYPDLRRSEAKVSVGVLVKF
jgi:hypothetical protein